MAKREEHQTTITLTLADGRIVDVKGAKGARVTKVGPAEFEKTSRRGNRPGYITTMAFSQEDGMCCYWIFIGGRWVKVCSPC
jgi:hypothetical protein